MYDVFLRYNKGPVQCFRAWDRQRFMESQVRQGEQSKEPYKVTVATEQEYRKEQRQRRRG